MSEERFSGSQWAVEQDYLGLCNAEQFEKLGRFDGEFNDFFDFHDLLFVSTNHIICGVGQGFNFLEGDKWVDLGGQYFGK